MRKYIFLQKSLRDSVVSCSSLHRLFRGIMGKNVTVANQFTETRVFLLGLLQFFSDNSLLFEVLGIVAKFLGFTFFVLIFLFNFFIM